LKKTLDKIDTFLQEHHVLSLATMANEDISVCNLFYTFDKTSVSFIVASDSKTVHIQHIQQNTNIAGSVVLETKTVGKIQGIQFQGNMELLKDKTLSKLYFKNFPYAKALLPTLYKITIQKFKMTDNTLGFGKKLLWNI